MFIWEQTRSISIVRENPDQDKEKTIWDITEKKERENKVRREWEYMNQDAK